MRLPELRRGGPYRQSWTKSAAGCVYPVGFMCARSSTSIEEPGVRFQRTAARLLLTSSGLPRPVAPNPGLIIRFAAEKSACGGSPRITDLLLHWSPASLFLRRQCESGTRVHDPALGPAAEPVMRGGEAKCR